ncbi:MULTISPECIES: acyltransferase [unclassified Campylobacter]|uniref:acyltransferase n=1 Tax=unclassified Campylobacter TaxID=2593542 RepID=UPI0022E9E3B1|nr:MULTISPECIES: acyltransferase family protein [unclassified Campylobacter]MDA3053844.1 acyltransferase family protein [Campylobacter sp. VBCF_07 NA4]MDA3060267.1 acyltransferase family protein [Campylobacter sp. VBCF_02 NA5]MDA3069783.1 acyltransferase family protein [Campylobacter sp. VBCF_08 NA3]WBR54889.1 acyltransferase family protein [Campylobacter sp. VBCF_01 NA2]
MHVAVIRQYKMPSQSYEWQIVNFYNGLVRWCVPVFVMVSGIFLLDFRRYSESVSENLGRILKKNIFRLSITLIVWSIFYLYFDMFLNGKFDTNPFRLTDFLFKSTKYHLWFLYMIIGLYFLAPFLQVLVRNLSKKDFELLLIVLAIFCCGYDFINVFLKFFLNKTLYFRSNVPEFSGYLIYFLAGFYFANFEISKRTRTIFYILAFISLVITIGFNSYFATHTTKGKEFIFTYRLINVMFVSFGVFIFFKNLFANFQNNGKFAKLITKLSALSFGIYLIHAAIRDIFIIKLQITNITLNPIIMIPLLSIAIFAISALLAFILSKIPILRKVV